MALLHQLCFTPPMKPILYTCILLSVSTASSALRFPFVLEQFWLSHVPSHSVTCSFWFVALSHLSPLLPDFHALACGLFKRDVFGFFESSIKLSNIDASFTLPHQEDGRSSRGLLGTNLLVIYFQPERYRRAATDCWQCKADSQPNWCITVVTGKLSQRCYSQYFTCLFKSPHLDLGANPALCGASHFTRFHGNHPSPPCLSFPACKMGSLLSLQRVQKKCVTSQWDREMWRWL